MVGTRQRRWDLVAAAVGVSIGSVLVLTAFAPGLFFGSVEFDGVQLSIAYSETASGLYGPAHQNACLEEPSISPPPPYSMAPDCPTELSGGEQYDFPIFIWGAPLNTSQIEDSVSIHFSIPFQAETCQNGLAPSAPARAATVTQEFHGGEYCGLFVVFTMPSPAPATSGGLWMYANASVQSP